MNSISSTCFELGNWPLSQVLLKNNANYPWIILIPRLENIQEIDQLSQEQGIILMDEISRLSSIMRAYFQPDKLNVGSLGNIVPQLHVHVVARFKQDQLWPHGIWQEAQETKLYKESELTPLLNDLRREIKAIELG